MALLSRVGTRTGAALVAVLILLSAEAAAQRADDSEKAVRAAFLYNFTKFIGWPDAAFDAASGRFRVCVFVDAAFRQDIDAMLAGETVQGRTIEVVTPESSSIRTCHIVYFGPGEIDRTAQLLASVRQSPVLAVGEGARFLKQGGLIAFVRENNRVRFDVNKSGVDRAGLTMSSKLLRVARNVAMGGPG